jgi:hypothetical protein
MEMEKEYVKTRKARKERKKRDINTKRLETEKRNMRTKQGQRNEDTAVC